MSDNPLYAELDRLRTELAANEVVAARLEEQRAKAEERVRELEASCAVMRQALEAQAEYERLKVRDYEISDLGKPRLAGEEDFSFIHVVGARNKAAVTRQVALATDAGKAMLERMAKQEGAVAEMRTVLEQCFDYLTMLSFVDFWEKWGIGVKATTWGTADKFVATNITKALAIKEAPDV